MTAAYEEQEQRDTGAQDGRSHCLRLLKGSGVAYTVYLQIFEKRNFRYDAENVSVPSLMHYIYTPDHAV